MVDLLVNPNPKKGRDLSDGQRKAILKELNESHEVMRKNQQEWRRKTDKIERYVAGKQLNYAGYRDGTLVGHEEADMPDVDNDVDKEYVISNEMKRVYLVDRQRMMAYYIRPEVIPPEKSAASKQTARASRIFLEDHLRKTDQQKMMEIHAAHLILHNKTFIKVTWDPSLGRSILKPRAGMFGTVKTWVLGKQEIPQGEIKWEFPSGKNLLFPQYTPNMEKTPEVEEFNIVTVDYVYRRWGVVVEGENITPDLGNMLGFNTSNSTGNGNNSEAGSPGPTGKKTHVLLKERWIRPCAEYQKGAIFTWAGETLLRSSNLKDYYPDIPFFDATMIPDDNDIFGTSILWDLIPLQNGVNRALSSAMRWLKMIAMLRLWIPESCELKEEDLNNATGMAVGISGSAFPQWDKIPEINESVFKMIDMFRGLISSYGYANELAKRGQTSGNALGILQEMDDTIFKPGLLSLQSMYSRACNFTCRIAAKYIDTPRMVMATSMQGWQIAQFKGDMMNSDFHVEVNLMTGLPTNKAMRLEFLKGLFKDGILTQDEVKTHLEFGTDNEALEEAQKQFEIVDARVEALMDFPANYNKVPDPETGLLTWECKIAYNSYDNHTLMVVKLQTALQENGEHWQQDLPYVKLAFLDQWNLAKQNMAMQAAKQAAAMQPPSGAGLPPPGPGLPTPDGPLPGADSIQAPNDQPPPGQVPPPINQGE